MPRLKPLSYSRLARVFELDGWIYRYTKGDHLIYVKMGCKRPVVIQNGMRFQSLSFKTISELLE